MTAQAAMIGDNRNPGGGGPASMTRTIALPTPTTPATQTSRPVCTCSARRDSPMTVARPAEIGIVHRRSPPRRRTINPKKPPTAAAAPAVCPLGL